MTEERSCGTCGHYVSDRCVRPGGCCFHHSNWQPIAQCKYGMNNCQFLGDEDTCAICVDAGFGLSEFLPNKRPIAQDKPMENKVIFESEEECAEFLCNVYNHNKEYCLRSLVPMAKQAGYIRKSAVEEAEEMYQEWLYAIEATRSPINKNNLNVKLYEAIQELKSEIARLKG